MRSFFVLLALGCTLLTIAIVVRSGMFMRENPGEPINAAMRQALAGKAYQWSEADAARLARDFPGGIETTNGARYLVTQPGVGEASPRKGQIVSVEYSARLFATGEKLDASADHGAPYNFVLGGANLLPGWSDALEGMRKGEKRTIVLPYWLAYGEKGQRDRVPAKASILLELELLDFRDPPPPAAPEAKP